jgi:predicted glycosyltransferase involved in capsule biosynthesis
MKLKRFSIVIPFKSDSGHRDLLMDYVYHRYKKQFPKAEIVIGEDTDEDGEFNRSRARNNGVKNSSNDILLLSDGDLIITKKTIEKGIRKLKESPFVIPWGRCYDINQSMTYKIIRKSSLNFSKLNSSISRIRDIRQEKLAGGIQLITRELYDRIDGYEELFFSWGWEDAYFCKKVEAALGDYPLLPDEKIYHLFHPHDKPNPNNYHLYNALI